VGVHRDCFLAFDGRYLLGGGLVLTFIIRIEKTVLPFLSRHRYDYFFEL